MQLIDIRQILLQNKNVKHKEFCEKLVPNVKNMLGIKMPFLRQIVKDIFNNNLQFEYIEKYQIEYFEEKMILGLVIANLKIELNNHFKYIEKFISLIDNWSICDSFCSALKIAKEYKNEFYEFAKNQIATNQVYSIRVGVCLILFHLIDENLLQTHFKIFDSIDNQDYYVKMVVAWAVSFCYIKYPQITYDYLLKSKLDNFTFNKSIQKICESFRVDRQDKIELKKLKRK